MCSRAFIFLAASAGLAAVLSPSARAQYTEVPTVVARGAWLVESTLAECAVDRYTPARDGVHTESLTLGSVFLTTGLCERVDVQAGFELSRRDRTSGPLIATQVSQGNGDLYLRSKWNFRGDESKGSALALLPYVKLPTNCGGVGNNSVEYGLIVPWGCPLGGDWFANAMIGTDVVDDGGGGRDVACTLSGVLFRQINPHWGCYIESIMGVQPEQSRGWASSAGLGLVYGITTAVQLDMACYAGLTRAAADWNPALRLVWAF